MMKKHILTMALALMATTSYAQTPVYLDESKDIELRVDDALSRMTRSAAGAVRETPAGENETRRVHTRSLTSGEEEARTEREFRLVTVEEELISMPRWVNYLRIILLLLLCFSLRSA